jgi:hypothetical protein
VDNVKSGEMSRVTGTLMRKMSSFELMGSSSTPNKDHFEVNKQNAIQVILRFPFLQCFPFGIIHLLISLTVETNYGQVLP